MNRRNLEGRLIINIVGGIIRQNDLHPIHQKVNWERIYRTSDYHKVASIIYLGTLGAYEDIPDKWKESFFNRYQQSLHYGEIYQAGENEILSLFTTKHISCVELTSPYLCGLYPVAGSCARSPLRLLIPDEEQYNRAKGFLIDNNFYTTTSWPEYGERMEVQDGLVVEIFRSLPFETTLYEKGIPKLIAGAYKDPDFPYTKQLSIEYNCVFSMAQVCYHYAEGQLTIRELLDHFLYYRHCQEEKMDERLVLSWYKRLGIDEIARDLIHIAYMWFDSLQNLPEKHAVDDLSIFDEVEDCILERKVPGNGSRQKQAVQMVQDIAKADERAKARKKRRDSLNKVKNGITRLFTPGAKTESAEEKTYLQVSPATGYVPLEMHDNLPVAKTPYFTLTFPLDWLGHVNVTTERMNEGYIGSKLPKEDRNPDNYRTVVSFVTGEGNEIPVIFIDMYNDPAHADMHRSRVSRSYHLGTLIHSIPDKTYNEYLIVHFPVPDYEGDDVELLDALRSELATVVKSLAPYKGLVESNEWQPSDEELV